MSSDFVLPSLGDSSQAPSAEAELARTLKEKELARLQDKELKLFKRREANKTRARRLRENKVRKEKGLPTIEEEAAQREKLKKYQELEQKKIRKKVLSDSEGDDDDDAGKADRELFDDGELDGEIDSDDERIREAAEELQRRDKRKKLVKKLRDQKKHGEAEMEEAILGAEAYETENFSILKPAAAAVINEEAAKERIKAIKKTRIPLDPIRSLISGVLSSEGVHRDSTDRGSKIPSFLPIIYSGMAKHLLYQLVTECKLVQASMGHDNQPIRPVHVHEAYRRLLHNGKIPGLSAPLNPKKRKLIGGFGA